MTSFAIGAKLRQERVGQGRTIADISEHTRIARRYIEAIENDDFSNLPGLIFTRNFVRQYALALRLDPDPLVAELPRQDESSVQLPNPPERKRSSYQQDRRMRSFVSSVVWILVGAGAGTLAYMHYNRSGQLTPRQVEAAAPRSNPDSAAAPASATSRPAEPAGRTATEAAAKRPTAPVVEKAAALSAPVNVVLTAHAPAWIEVTADGKTTFVGTLRTDEAKNISAAEQIKVLTGNAGALTISLNGKTLDSLGPVGQVRSVRLTAEGPAPLSKAPPPASDPL